MINLKKLSRILVPAMLACSFSLVAHAEIDPGYVKMVLNNPEINREWPLATQCIGSDVNLRTQPNTNCEVITMLQPGDNFYVTGVYETPQYNWLKGVTDKGEQGYMVSRYLEAVENSATRKARFKAAFMVSKTYNPESFAASLGVKWQPNYTKADPEVFHYSPHKVNVAGNFVHGEAFNGSDYGFQVIGMQVLKNNYSFAGLKVGDTFNKEAAKTLNKDMMYLGWNEIQNIDEVSEYYWYRDGSVDGQTRPVEAFAVLTKNNVIREIKWQHVVID